MSLLKSVQTGRKLKPLAIMLHAPHGIGKSTFATEAPNPIYIGQEENDELDVARFPKVMHWSELIDQLTTLRDEKHDYKTVVIDTADGLEQTAEKDILGLDINKGKTMATAYGGYGKAYEKMGNMFLKVRDEFLIPLRDEKGMNVVILCHSKKVKHEEPMTNTSYDHYETALHKRTKAIFEDWVSAILFANHALIKAEGDDGQTYTTSLDGERLIFTQERPSHVAKNRFDMPYDIPFTKKGTWGVIRNLVLAHFKTVKKKTDDKKEVFNDEVSDLKKAIEEKLAKLPDDLRSHLEAKYKTLKTAGEAKKLLAKIEGALA